MQPLSTFSQEPPPPDQEGVDVQTRGPVHEAFAGIVEFNPQPGTMVTKAPPDPIEELPPEEKPEGDNVTWIPGYWGWDDERNDFLWISGTWRALPPGRAWVAGYWAHTAEGYQWTSGYWVDAAQKDATYLPTPPATIEAGPNVPTPSPDYIWMPGCWVWASAHYAWRPGYWAAGQPDWDWVPAHYVCTPRGYIFVGGYWDYPVARRGVLFAPVFFAPGVYAHRAFVYSPAIVIDLGVFPDHLFCRPSYHHYYFGDYYAPSYARGGFYASFSFQIGHRGYDPIFSHERFVHRNDRDWDHRFEAGYTYRREHEDARPPRTWVQQRNVTVNKNVTINRTRVENKVIVANTFDQYRKTDNAARFQAVPREERQRLGQRNREVQTTREQRQTVELQSRATTRPNEASPFRAAVPKSPIVSTPSRETRLNPPRAPREPRPDTRVRPQQQRPPQKEHERNEPQRSPSAQVTPPNVERNVERSSETPERRLPSRPQPRQQVASESAREDRVTPAPQAPSTPPAERRLPARPQTPREERESPAPPATRTPTGPEPERHVPSRSQEARAPVVAPERPTAPSRPMERQVTPEVRGRMATPAPRVSRPETSAPNAPRVERGRGPSYQSPSPNANRAGRKGAEQLRPERQPER